MDEILVVPDDRQEHDYDRYRDDDLIVHLEVDPDHQYDDRQYEETVVPFHGGKTGPDEIGLSLDDPLVIVFHRVQLERSFV